MTYAYLLLALAALVGIGGTAWLWHTQTARSEYRHQLTERDAEIDEYHQVALNHIHVNEELHQQLRDLRATLQAAYDVAVDHDDRLPFDWAVYCEMLHHALNPK